MSFLDLWSDFAGSPGGGMFAFIQGIRRRSLEPKNKDAIVLITMASCYLSRLILGSPVNHRFVPKSALTLPLFRSSLRTFQERWQPKTSLTLHLPSLQTCQVPLRPSVSSPLPRSLLPEHRIAFLTFRTQPTLYRAQWPPLSSLSWRLRLLHSC